MRHDFLRAVAPQYAIVALLMFLVSPLPLIQPESTTGPLYTTVITYSTCNLLASTKQT